MRLVSESSSSIPLSHQLILEIYLTVQHTFSTDVCLSYETGRIIAAFLNEPLGGALYKQGSTLQDFGNSIEARQ